MVNLIDTIHTLIDRQESIVDSYARNIIDRLVASLQVDRFVENPEMFRAFLIREICFNIKSLVHYHALKQGYWFGKELLKYVKGVGRV